MLEALDAFGFDTDDLYEVKDSWWSLPHYLESSDEECPDCLRWFDCATCRGAGRVVRQRVRM